MDLKAMAPCGGLASTAHDLARWSAFVADPASLLSADTLEEMCQPQILLDHDQLWTGAMGLGFFLMRSPTGRTWVGHTGGMPGHITGVFTHRESGTGGIVLMNATVSPGPDAFAIELADHVVEHDPVEDAPWQPGTVGPRRAARRCSVAGSRRGSPSCSRSRRASCEARIDEPAADGPAAVASSRRSATTSTATVSGRERGELLRVTRAADGTVTKLNWATYLFTREPQAFGRTSRSQEAVATSRSQICPSWATTLAGR